jgi:hypothetical protein
MAMSNSISGMPPQLIPTTYGPKWIAGLHVSVTVPTSSWDSFVMQGSMSTNFAEAQ